MRRFLHERPQSCFLITPQVFSYLLSYRHRHHGRHVYAYGSYPTPSKGNVGLLPKSASTLAWVNKYEENIMYHAAWRVHLYFLLLVVYHNQQRIIQMDSTELQHGVGIAPFLQACHTSLFPSLVDYSIKDHRKNRQQTQTSIIDNSFLNDWNNMTVTCPEISNRFDTFLEGRGSGSLFRKQLLFILNACSLGVYEPHDALKFFFMQVGIALKEKREFIEKFHSINKKRAAKRVIFLQEKGMFSLASRVNHSPNMDVIDKVLQWDRQSGTRSAAYLRTQQILLTGGKKEAVNFLKRFEF